MDKKVYSGTTAERTRQEQSHDRPDRAECIPRDRRRARRRIAFGVRGLIFAGVAYLFGSSPLAFGAAPLGIALLMASTEYTWYILAGLILAALTRPVTLPAAALVGVYTLGILLRLAVLFFVDPPEIPGQERRTGARGTLRYAGKYLSLCLRSMSRNLGLDVLFARRNTKVDTETDYYAGSPWERTDREKKSPDESNVWEPKPQTETPLPPLADRAGLFSEHPFLRALTGALTGFAAGIIGLFYGGFHMYDLFAALLLVFATPACVMVLISVFGETGETLLFSPHPLGGTGRPESLSVSRLMARFRLMPLVSVGSLLVGVGFCTRRLSFSVGTPYLTVHVGLLLGIVLTLSAVSRLGLVPGLATALLMGVGTGPERLPIFLLTAAVYAFLRILSHRSAVIGGALSGILWCAAYNDMTGFLTDLPAICLSAPVFFLLERLWERMPLSVAEEELIQSDFTLAVTGELQLAAGREQLKSLSRALRDVSDRMGRMAVLQQHGGEDQLKRICTESVNAVCAVCPARESCQGAVVDSLLSQLMEHGRVDAAYLTDCLPTECTRREQIATDLNGRAMRLLEEQVRGSKANVMAADYAHMAVLLADVAAGDAEEETRLNREAADRVFDYLSALGVTVQGVVVCGRRKRRVIVRGRGLEKLRAKGEELAAGLGKLCFSRLAPPQFETRDGCTVMTLYSLPYMDVRYAGSTVPVGTGDVLPPPLLDDDPGRYCPPTVCGDHIAVFRNEQACFYALISDGMGSGDTASAVSETCVAFLERMLSAGSHVEISLRMLNGYLRARGSGSGDECSATVDLMELDTACGHAVFAKNGAAPTYVIRGGTVYKLRSRSLPLGILQDSKPQLLRFRMRPGDVVVMVSDGVTLGNDECPWLIDLLSDPLPDSMDSLRLDILRRAMASGSPDDLSAIAIRVEESAGEHGV